MTKIESVFGGLLALGILGVFAFVMFGGEAVSREGGRHDSRTVRAGTAALLLGEADGSYVPPSTPCGCYDLGFDLVREGLGPDSVTYESQLHACFDRLGALGAAAFDDGTKAGASSRSRKVCGPETYR